MAFLSARIPYICQCCTHNISRRPKIRQSTRIVLQWRNYSDFSLETPADPHVSKHSLEHIKLADPESKAQSSNKTIADRGSLQQDPPSSNTDASFRIAKHFNRDPKLKARTNLRAPNSALEVDLSDGNRMGYSRHRIPVSTPRTRPLRKIHSLELNSELEVEAELTPSLPSYWPSEKLPSHTQKIQSARLEDCNWYWETLPPTKEQKAKAAHFFVNGAAPKFLRSMALFRAFPESDVPEVAFVGRSNVGKSSLLNAIVNADTNALLAKTSSTPGFTKTMNLYGVGPGNGVNIVKTQSRHDKIEGPGGVTIVDMPGYGEGSLSEWGLEIMKYLQGRKQLRRVFVLLDAQHGIKDKDRSLLASLRLGGIPHQIILSKLDKIYIPKFDSIKRVDGKSLSRLKPKGSLDTLQHIMNEIRTEIQPPVGGGALGEILGCSSEVIVNRKRLGIDAVRFAILQATGFDFRAGTGKKKDVAQLVRTMKTTPPLAGKRTVV